MKLINLEMTIDKIMLDPFNPRFGKNISNKQSEIRAELMKDTKTKELLNSMKSGLTWVNKIVVRSVDSYTQEIREKLGEDANEHQYVVVEGNTRLACLKDEKMAHLVTNQTLIPVILAEKDDDEEQIEYEKEVKRIQGISNIMIVKDWEPIPKAKYIYEIYMEKKRESPDTPDTNIFKEINTNLGIKLGEVKSFVYRYMFYRQVTENVTEIDKDDFKFFEVFEQNREIRNTFGWVEKEAKFIWECDNTDEKDATDKEELLELFPDIIESAKREKVSSKDIRDIIRKNHDTKSVEDFVNEIKQVVSNESDEYCYNNWRATYFEKVQQNDEQKWSEEIEKVHTTIQAFPVGANWAKEQKIKLEQVQKSVSRLIKMLEIAEMD